MSGLVIALGMVGVGVLVARPPAVSDASVAAWSPVVDAALRVIATGRAAQWQFTFQGPDGVFGTADDITAVRDLHVPTNTQVHLQLRSSDEVYVFGIPQLGLRQIAVPDLDFELTWRTGSTASYELKGDAMCGSTHPTLQSHLTVESAPRFIAWLTQVSGKPTAPPQAP